MELNIGFVGKNDQLIIATLENDTVTTTSSEIITKDDENDNTAKVSDHTTTDLYGIVYEGEMPDHDFGQPFFISSKETLPLSPNMSFSEMVSKIKEHTNHQSLKEITKTIENITSLSEQFKSIYNSSRNEFFKELWQLIRRCFLTQHLSIFYYNIDKKSKEGKLSLQKISGSNTFTFAQTDKEEVSMFETIKPHITPSPSVLSYDFEKGELTLCAQINGTSFLVLAKIFQFTLLQRTLFISLINGINHQLGTKTSKKASS